MKRFFLLILITSHSYFYASYHIERAKLIIENIMLKAVVSMSYTANLEKIYEEKIVALPDSESEKFYLYFKYLQDLGTIINCSDMELVVFNHLVHPKFPGVKKYKIGKCSKDQIKKFLKNVLLKLRREENNNEENLKLEFENNEVIYSEERANSLLLVLFKQYTYTSEKRERLMKSMINCLNHT